MRRAITLHDLFIFAVGYSEKNKLCIDDSLTAGWMELPAWHENDSIFRVEVCGEKRMKRSSRFTNEVQEEFCCFGENSNGHHF